MNPKICPCYINEIWCERATLEEHPCTRPRRFRQQVSKSADMFGLWQWLRKNKNKSCDFTILGDQILWWSPSGFTDVKNSVPNLVPSVKRFPAGRLLKNAFCHWKLPLPISYCRVLMRYHVTNKAQGTQQNNLCFANCHVVTKFCLFWKFSSIRSNSRVVWHSSVVWFDCVSPLELTSQLWPPQITLSIEYFWLSLCSLLRSKFWDTGFPINSWCANIHRKMFTL